MRKRNSLLVAGACLASLACTVATAMADPIGDPVFRDLAGVGSDTTNAVLNGLANGTGPGTGFGGITINGIRVIGSYDAFGSAQITTKQTPPASCTIRRPAGSVNGLNALVADTNGCIQFARSTVNDGRPGLRYLRFAVDAVTYVTRPDSLIPRSLTVAQLITIYNCQGPAADPPGPAGPTILPLLPGPGSGTRDFFLTRLGFTPGAFSTAPGQGHECVRDTNLDGVTPLDENDGRALFDPRHIAPYSISQYLSQAHGLSPDTRGLANLRSINGIGPVMLNPNSVMSRDTYNVLRDSQVGTPPFSTVFAGPGSLVCTNTATIKRFGFAPHPLCGT